MFTFIFGVLIGVFMVKFGFKMIKNSIEKIKRRRNLWYRLEQEYLEREAAEKNEIVANN